MYYKYKIRTEKETVMTNALEFGENYCWVEDLKTLYRILEEDNDSQPDAVVFINDCHTYSLCKVGEFEDSEKAFYILAYDTAKMMKIVKELKDFLQSHSDDFDIPDNQNAQCPGYGWAEC